MTVMQAVMMIAALDTNSVQSCLYRCDFVKVFNFKVVGLEVGIEG